MSTTATLIQYYENILLRPPTGAEIAERTAQVDNGSLTLDQIRDAIINSEESQTYPQQLIRIYQTAFGRVPDRAGLDGWVDMLRDGAITTTDIAIGFVFSAEWSMRFGSSEVSSAILQTMYQNVLGRDGSDAEISAWMDTGLSLDQILLGFANSAEFQAFSASCIVELQQRAGDVTDAATVYLGVGGLCDPVDPLDPDVVDPNNPGGGGTPNTAPTIISDGAGATAALTSAENQKAVTTVVATDLDNHAISYSLNGGADQALFDIDATSGVLSFINAPDFETKADTNGDGVYEVLVTASDGGLTDRQDIAVTVTDVNDAPVITSDGGGANAAVNAAENQTAVTTVTATDQDGDNVTFAITGGVDSALFNIVGATGALTFNKAPDFNTKIDDGNDGVYDVQVTATDNGAGNLTDVQDIAVTVTNVNDAPVITSDGGGANAAVNAAENQTAVTTVTATDQDGDNVTFAITGGADGALFDIVAATGVLTFKNAPDFETKADAGGNGVYDVQVTATDNGAGNLSDVQDIAVTVTDVNDAPVITSDGGGANAAVNAAENQTAVTTVTATDQDGDNVTFAITGGADGALFDIVAATGVLTFKNAPDFETKADAGGNGVYDVQVTATDDGTGLLSDVQDIAVAVTDVNEAPEITSNGGGVNAAVNAAENQTAVTTVVATDPENDTRTYSITGGADGALFDIVAATGVLTFKNAPDFETKADAGGNGVYDVQVTATDNGAGNLTDVQDIAVTVTDVNDAPVITSDGGGANAAVNAAENQTAVTTVTATDQDGDNVTFSITGGADSALFDIVAATGVLTFKNAPDFETKADAGGNGVYDVQVTATDDGTGLLSDVQDIAVAVTDVNEAPEITSNGGGANAAVNAAENQTAVTTVVATDPENDTRTYSITGGADGALFDIVAATGVLTFKNAPDFETKADAGGNGVYDVQVTATDNGAGNLTDVQDIAVTVTDVNEAPVITSDGGGANAAVNAAENQTAVTTVVATDPENDTRTYSITGGADGALFDIVAATGVLTFKNAPDFETKADAGGNGVYDVQVTATDNGAGNLTDVQDIAVTVTDVNEAPEITSNGGGANAAVNAAENQTAVTTVVATDPENDTRTYSITGGADGALFDIVAATGVLTFKNAPDFETKADAGGNGVYDVQVTATDNGAGNLTDVQDIAVTVTDVNDAPVITSDGGGANAAVNSVESQTAVTTVTATDQDGDNVAFSITGGADSALFDIVAGTGVLTFKNAPDFNTKIDDGNDGVYDVQVTATDDGTGLLTDVQDIAVTVTELNTAPVITSDGGGATAMIDVAERQTDATTVTATDAENDNLTFSISGGADELAFNIDPGSGVLTFKSAPDFTNKTDVGTNGVFDVQVTVTDDGAGMLADVQDIAITVTEQAWFIDNSVAGIGGTGTAANPFRTIAEFNAANGQAGGPAAGDTVYLREGTGTYTEADGFDLLDDQVVVGQGQNLVIGGVTVETGSVGQTPSIVISGAGNNAFDLKSGNTITGVDIGNTTGSAFSGNTVGTLTVSDVAISGSGQAVDINGGTLDVTLESLKSTSSTGEAVDLDSVTGAFKVTGVTDIDNATSVGIDVAGSSTIDLDFAGIDVNGATGGLSLSGGVGSFDATGLVISNVSGTGFKSAGSGTINVTGAGNTIASTGTAVDIQGTTIGGSGITLQSVNVNGTATGIVLNDTGSGAFSVTGDGTSATVRGGNGSGGTIQNATGDGISLTDAANVNLAHMVVKDAGAQGIDALRVNGLTLDGVTLNGNGNGNLEHGLKVVDATGTYDLSQVFANNGSDTHITVLQQTGGTNLTTFVVDDSTLQNVTTGSSEDGIQFDLRTGTVTGALTVQNSTFSNHDGDHIQVALNGSASVTTTTIHNNVMTATGANLGGGITIGHGGSFSASHAIHVTNNNIQDASAQSINVNVGSHIASADVRATITGNTIGTLGDAGSGGNTGIEVELNGVASGTLTALLTDNNIYEFENLGIELSAVDGLNIVGVLNATLLGNTVRESTAGGAPFSAIFVDASHGNTINLDLGGAGLGDGNTVVTSGFADIAFRTQSQGFSTINLEGYVGAASDAGLIQTYLQGRNDGTPSVAIQVISGAIQGSGPVPLPMLSALGEGTGVFDPLTDAMLAPILAEAVARWADLGLPAETLGLLDGTSVYIADLTDGMLGAAVGDHVFIDVDAAGWGWFVDQTPADDDEFSLLSENRFGINEEEDAQHMDLLTVVMHELGHIIGLTHEAGGLLSAELDLGTRLTPEFDHVHDHVLIGQESLSPEDEHYWLM